MKKSSVLITVFLLINITIQAQTVTDYDGNVYHTISIGAQTWFAENLKATHFNTGETIQNITSNSDWKSATTPAYSWYNNDFAVYGTVYGALYNWYVINSNSNICPSGWRIPTDNDWNTLINFLGGTNIAGGKMKETGTLHWQTPNINATNESKFTALPSGNRDGNDGVFKNIGLDNYLWSKSGSNGSVWFRYLGHTTAECGAYSDIYKQDGFSIRCIKSNSTGFNEKSNQNFLIYPNPVENILNIKTPENIKVTLKLYDYSGKQLLNKQFTANTAIDTGNLPNGFYYIELLTIKDRFFQKIMK